MGDWALEAGLRFEGLTDAQIATVEAAIPDLIKLKALINQALPIIVSINPAIDIILNAVASEEKEHS